MDGTSGAKIVAVWSVEVKSIFDALASFRKESGWNNGYDRKNITSN